MQRPIIHAAGVRVGFSIICRREQAKDSPGLPCRREPFELVAEILEVIPFETQAEHFVDTGRK